MREVWHDGERRMHRELGIEDRMRERGAIVVRDAMPDQHRHFFEDLRFVVLSALDKSGHPWVFLRTGTQGFVSSPDPTQLRITSHPLLSEPPDLKLEAGDKISVLGIEFETRRRNRMNGTIQSNDGTSLSVQVDQSFGNCPRYIHTRDAVRFVAPLGKRAHRATLNKADTALIRASNMLFIASRSPQISEDRRAGVDVNHRGGQPGFVKVLDAKTLVIPDYDGNKFFNTIGNLLLDTRVSIMLTDFRTGDVLTVGGHAAVIRNAGARLDEFGAERGIKITVDSIYAANSALPLRYDLIAASRDAPQPGIL